MTEFEIYLPSTYEDGRKIAKKKFEDIKARLSAVYGGYTHFKQRSEGAWKFGGVTFREEVTILRVLDDGSRRFDMKKFKAELERTLRQEQILIVRRRVGVVK